MPTPHTTPDRTRGRELWLLGRIALPDRLDTPQGPVSGAAMLAVLRAIDDHAHSPQRDQPLTLAAAADARGDIQPGIADRTGLSERTVRRAIAGLVALRLIDVERYRDRHGRSRSRYIVDWARVDGWVRGDVSHDPPSHHDDTGHDAATPAMVPVTTGHGDRSPPAMVAGRSIYARAYIAPPPPPTQRAPDTGDAWAAVAAAMSACGVSSVWPAIDAARTRGATPDHLSAVVDHWRAHAPRCGWGAAALRHRVATAGPGVDVADGWPPPRSGPSGPAPGDLAAAESRLRAMPRDDLDALAARVLTGGVADLYVAHGLAAGVVRETLARALCRAEVPR